MTKLLPILFALSAYLSFPLPKSPKQRIPKTVSVANVPKAPASTTEILQALRLIRICLSSGMTIAGTLEFVQIRMSEPVFSEIAQVLYKSRLGRPLVTALTELANENPRWLPITDAMIVGLTSGSSIQEQLSDFEVMLRTTHEMEKLKRIKSVAVKSVLPLGICFLPAFILLAVIPLVAGLIGNVIK